MSKLEDLMSLSSESSDEGWLGYETDDSDKDYAANENHAVRSTFKIGTRSFQDLQLTKLVRSSAPEDKNTVQAVVKQLMKDDNTEVFGYLLFRGYKMDPLNDEGQNTVHLLFYEEYKRIIERQAIKDVTKKQPVFCSSLQKTGLSSMGFMKRIFFYQDHKELLKHSELLSTLVSEWLVKGKPSLDLTPTDCYGLTYMHIACLIGESNLVKKCIKNGMDVNARFNNPDVLYKNYTPLHFGVLNPLRDTADIVHVLLHYGADVAAKDSLGRTPLHLACRLHHEPCDFYIINEDTDENLKMEDLARCIVENPGDFYTKNSNLVDTLLKKGSDVNAKDEAGNTPLHSVFPEKYNDELSRLRDPWHDFGVPIRETAIKFAFLVKAGADVTTANGNGDTILHLIARNLKLWRNSSSFMEMEFDDSYHVEMMGAAIRSCPQLNVNVENNRGETPIQLAFECLSLEIVKLLSNHGADLSTLALRNNLFCYPDVAPNDEAVRNLVSMAELFQESGFKFTDEAHLEVLKFLVHFTSSCQCPQRDYRHYALIFGSKYHVKSVLNRIDTRPDSSSSDDVDDEDSDADDQRDKLDDLAIYLDVIKGCDAYIDEEIRGMMEDLTEFDYPEFKDSATQRIREELKTMKSTVLQNDVSVYDVITAHPHNVPRSVVNKIDGKAIGKFKIFQSIVKGQVAKATVRYYVVKSAGCYVQDLLPSLPYVFCQMIVQHLSNEAILNVCIAVNTKKATEKCLLVEL